jgi:predicted choloylglycine hydrolase
MIYGKWYEYTIREGTFQHIVLEGTSYEVGKMQGEIIKETKDKNALASFASNDDVPEKLGFENFNEMKALYEELCPGIMEELQGLADSLDIPVEKIAFYQESFSPGHCAHAVAFPAITKDDHVYVGRSYESSIKDHESIWDVSDWRLCTTRVKGKSHHIGFSSLLLGRIDGLNQYGLSITLSGGTVADWSSWKSYRGMDFMIIFRSILDNCKTVKEAIELLKSTPPITYAHIMVVDRTGNAALMEIAGNQFAMKEINEASDEEYLIATNHYRLGDLPQYNKKEGVMGHSTARYRAIESSIKEDSPKVTRETFRDVLTREIPDGCFCPYYSYNLGTLRSMIFDLTDGNVEVCFGAPTHNDWHKFALDDPVGVKEYKVRFPDKKV